MSSNNRKVSVILLRSVVFVVLAYWVGKVSTKLPRSGSFLNMGKVSIKLLRSAVLSTQKCVHRNANICSLWTLSKIALYGRISQVDRGVYLEAGHGLLAPIFILIQKLRPKNLGPKVLVEIGAVTFILLIWTNVTRTYVAGTNVILMYGI